MVASFNKPGFDFSSESDKTSLVDLESRRRKIILDHEQEVRQKSRATWILCGDDNTSFFPNFPIIERILILFGKLRMIMDFQWKVLF